MYLYYHCGILKTIVWNLNLQLTSNKHTIEWLRFAVSTNRFMVFANTFLPSHSWVVQLTCMNHDAVSVHIKRYSKCLLTDNKIYYMNQHFILMRHIEWAYYNVYIYILFSLSAKISIVKFWFSATLVIHEALRHFTQIEAFDSHFSLHKCFICY